MKFNVTQQKTQYPNLIWYRYDTKCERCGKIHEAVKEGWVTSQYPDFSGLDLCVDCLQELLKKENKPTYEELKKQLYVPYEVEIKDYEGKEEN